MSKNPMSIDRLLPGWVVSEMTQLLSSPLSGEPLERALRSVLRPCERRILMPLGWTAATLAKELARRRRAP